MMTMSFVEVVVTEIVQLVAALQEFVLLPSKANGSNRKLVVVEVELDEATVGILVVEAKSRSFRPRNDAVPL